jgi:hypothetical protein
MSPTPSSVKIADDCRQVGSESGDWISSPSWMPTPSGAVLLLMSKKSPLTAATAPARVAVALSGSPLAT